MACGCGRKKNIRAIAPVSYKAKSAARMKEHLARLKSARKQRRR